MSIIDIQAQLTEANRKAHAERLQAAKSEVRIAGDALSRLQHWDHMEAIARLIDAKVALALLERGGG